MKMLLAVSLLACSGCAPQKKASPLQPVATLSEVMHNIVSPNAEVVWNSAGTIYTLKETVEIQPKDNDEWVEVEQSATALTEAGNLLMMEGRAKDSGHWMERARALREAGAAVHKAAKARSVQGVFDTGGQLFEACQGCHFEYRFEKDPLTIRTH
jgi:hypothetical protein